ncbi:MAG: Hpt domain-containing protein, partial [Desulfuromonas sp.]
MESALLELEERPTDLDVVGQVFRAMHTIKGSGAMFGFDSIARFTHEVETVYDLVRAGQLPVSKTLVDLSLQARDHIAALLQASCEGTAADLATGEALVRQFKALIPTSGAAPSVAVEKAAGSADEPQSYRIRLTPHPDILKNGTRMSSLLDELAELGTCRTIAHKAKVPPLDAIDPEQCYVRWDILLTTSAGIEAIRDVFIFVE